MNQVEDKTDYSGLESMLRFIEVIILKRKFVIITFIVVTLPVFVYLLVTPPLFMARTTLLPSESDGLGSFSSIAGVQKQVLGISFPTGGEGSFLYTAVLRSWHVIYTVLHTTFHSTELDNDLPLIDILDIPGETEAERDDNGFRLFKDEILEINTNENGVIVLGISTEVPQLSADIANEFIHQLDIFLRETKMAKAGESRTFIESRLNETQTLLQAAEEVLRDFRKKNKRIENSPSLLLEQGRLMREERIQEGIYLTLKQEYEIIKIEEVKNLTTLRILDVAIAPVYKDKPERLKIMFITMFVALVLGGLGAHIIDFSKGNHSDSKYYSIILNIRNILMGDLKSFRNRILGGAIDE